jgi:hypothetical protein
VNEQCGEPARYWWAPRNHPARMMAMCKQHGEDIAGNYVDELTLISPFPSKAQGALSERSGDRRAAQRTFKNLL